MQEKHTQATQARKAENRSDVLGGRNEASLAVLSRKSRRSLVLAVLLAVQLFLSGCAVHDVTSLPRFIATLFEEHSNPSRSVTAEIAAPKSYEEIYAAVQKNISDVPEAIATLDLAAPAEAADAEATASQPSVTPKQEAPSEPSIGNDTATNVQVLGVDEADIVKTDGSNLYLAKGSQIQIVAASGAASKRLGGIQIPRYSGSAAAEIEDLYVQQERLVVIFCTTNTSLGDSDDRSDKSYTSPRSTTSAAIYDISDPSKPALLEILGQEGTPITSRLANGTLYLLSRYHITDPYYGYYDPIDPDDVAAYVPSLYAGGNSTGCIAPENVRIVPEDGAIAYVVISSIDIKKAKRIDDMAILSGSNEQYMSSASLYLVSKVNPDVHDQAVLAADSERLEAYRGSWSRIMRLNLSNGTIELAASAFLPGDTDSQFSLDEYQGNLRVALTLNGQINTTSDAANSNELSFSASSVNDLYVLDSDLKVLGSITNLAPGERIHAVRYDGPVGYVVTFRQTDPLFSIDLSNPHKPEVMDALKIPGFSEYLHPWANGRLLGFGVDADQRGVTEGLKLSMFDVNDPFNVNELSSAFIKCASSDALRNHKAILVDPERQLVGFVAAEQYSVAPAETSGSETDVEPGYWSGYETEYTYYLYSYVEAVGQKPAKAGEFKEIANFVLGPYGEQARGMFIGGHFYLCQEESVTVCSSDTIEPIKVVYL